MELPHARVRLIDTKDEGTHACRICGRDAVLRFEAEVLGTVRVQTTCQDHAGDAAFAAAYSVVAGPGGTV